MKKQAPVDFQRIATHLQADESLQRVFHVILPPPSTGTAWGPAALVVPLVVIVRDVMWKRAAAAAQEEVGIHLRPRMLWALTEKRILLFSAGKRWQLGELLGGIARTDVVGATAPTVGQGWRTVVIALTASRGLSIKVGPTIADDLAADLTPRAGSGRAGDG